MTHTFRATVLLEEQVEDLDHKQFVHRPDLEYEQEAGGNQRELARQKNLKKTQEIHKGKRKEDSLSASQRKQRDSEIMQQKQKAANERKSMQAGAK